MLYFCCKVNHYVPADATSELYDPKDKAAFFPLYTLCSEQSAMCAKKEVMLTIIFPCFLHMSASLKCPRALSQ